MSSTAPAGDQEMISTPQVSDDTSAAEDNPDTEEENPTPLKTEDHLSPIVSITVVDQSRPPESGIIKPKKKAASFREQWRKISDFRAWLMQGEDETQARCSYCDCILSAHLNDIRKHAKTKKHKKKFAEMLKHQNNLVPKTTDVEDMKVCKSKESPGKSPKFVISIPIWS